MRPTFSSAFTTIHTLNIKLRNRHSALHLKTPILNIEQLDRYSALHSKPYTLNIELFVRHSALHLKWDLYSGLHPESYTIEYRAMGWTLRSIFSSASKFIHNLNFELWVRHSALHSKLFILNFELWDRYSALHSKSYRI